MNYYTYQDVFYTSSASTLEYVIKLGNEYIFRGLAVRGPEDCFAYINVGEICRQYLSNSIPDFTDFSNNRVVQNKMVLTFGLYAVLIDRDYTCPEEWEDIVVEEFLEDYTFLYNWDYEGLWDGTDRVISDPVNGHLDCRMKAMLTEFRETGDFDFYVTPTLYSPASGATLHAVISSETLTEDEKLTITITDSSITYSSLSMTGVDFIVPANTGNSKNAVVHYFYDSIHVGSTLIMIESEYGCYIDPSWKYSTYTDLSLTAYELETVTGNTYISMEFPKTVLGIVIEQQETDKNIDMTISGTTHFIIEKRKWGDHQACYTLEIKQLNNETPQLGETFTASMFMNNQLYTSWTVTVTEIIGYRTFIGEGYLFAQTEDFLPIKVMPIDYVYTDDVVLPDHPYRDTLNGGFVYNRYISAYHIQDDFWKIIGTGFFVDTFWTNGFYAEGSECYNKDMTVGDNSVIGYTTIFNLAGNGDLARFYATQHFDCPMVHVSGQFKGTLLGFPSAQSIIIHVHSGVKILDIYLDNVTLEEFNALPLPPIYTENVDVPTYHYPAYRTKLYVFHREQHSSKSMNITVHCKDGVTSWSPDLYLPEE